MKLIKLIIFLLILILAALGLTPFNFYYSQLEKYMRPIKLENISGSVVKGSAESLKYLGMDLGRINWLLYPSSYDAITLDFDVSDKLYDFNGKVIKKKGSQIIKGLSGTADWSLIQKNINFNHGEISGYFDFDFSHVAIKDGVPQRIVGTVTTKDFKLLKPLQKDLGEVKIEFNSDNPQIIVGQINSQSNVINISGAIYIHKSRRWEIKLTLLPMPGEYEIEYALQSIGDKRAGGGRSLNMAGFY